MNNRRNRVFISYNYNDWDIAHKIAEALRNEQIDVFIDYNDIGPGENAFAQIRYMYESNETVIVLLSKSLFSSDYFQYEFPQYFFEEARKRKVNIIPILIQKCQVPRNILEFEIVKMTNNFEKGLGQIIQKLKIIPKISFDDFTSKEFEEFTYDLLKAYKFRNIQTGRTLNFEKVDFIAENYTNDVFGTPNKETWMVEVKFYRTERFSINQLYQIINLHNYINREDVGILLITNSVLTSVAEDYIKNAKQKRNLKIKVVDGILLKKLVAKKKGSLLNISQDESSKHFYTKIGCLSFRWPRLGSI